MADLRVTSDDNYKTIKQICCSTKTYLVGNFIWALLSFGILIYGVVGAFLRYENFVFFPTGGYLAAGAISLVSLLVILLGIIGARARVEIFFILYMFFAGLMLLAHIIGFAFLIVYTIDVAAIKTLEDPIFDAQNSLEDHLEALATDDLAAWRDTQNTLDCCGIDFEFALSNPGVADTGDKCDELENVELNIEDLEDPASFDDFGNFIEAREDPIIGFDADFFCKVKISADMEGASPLVFAVSAVMLLIQIVCLVAAGRFYYVPEFLGGWYYDEEELDQIATDKKVIKPDKEYTGGRVLSTIRNQAQRVSFRLKLATTADPNVDPGQSFLKRFSTNRVSFEGNGGVTTSVNNRPEKPEKTGGRFSVQSMMTTFSRGPKSFFDTNLMKGNSTTTPQAALEESGQTGERERLAISTKSNLLENDYESAI